MTDQSVSTFRLFTSGQPMIVPNASNATSSISVSYTVEGSPEPGTLVVTLEAIVYASGGSVGVLDTWTWAGSNVSGRSVSLPASGVDAFQATATWSGGGPQTHVLAEISASGNGPAFSHTQDLSAIFTYSS
jgi:hypothetical protein